MQVRDQALGQAQESLPESDAGKEYALNRMQVRAVSLQSWALAVGYRGLGCCPSAAGTVAAAPAVVMRRLLAQGRAATAAADTVCLPLLMLC